MSAIGFDAAPAFTILLTSAKWSETLIPLPSQASFAFSITAKKFRHWVYSRTGRNSRANQYSIPFLGLTCLICSKTLRSFLPNTLCYLLCPRCSGNADQAMALCRPPASGGGFIFQKNCLQSLTVFGPFCSTKQLYVAIHPLLNMFLQFRLFG